MPSSHCLPLLAPTIIIALTRKSVIHHQFIKKVFKQRHHPEAPAHDLTDLDNLSVRVATTRLLVNYTLISVSLGNPHGQECSEGEQETT
jgi:hypothetical protein